MNELIVSLARLGSHSLNGFWLPLTVWTVAAVIVLVALRFYRGLHPLVQCDVRSALLLALPMGVLLAALIQGPLSYHPESDSVLYETVVFSSEPAVVTASPVKSVQALPVSRPPLDVPFWIGLATVAAALVAFLKLLMLGRDAFALRRFRRSLRWIDREELETLVPVDLHTRGTRYAVSGEEAVPMTFGFHRPVVVLPAYLLNQPHDLRLALQHEQVHVQRRDYLRQWIEQIVAALFAMHPVVKLLRRQIDEYREQACDAEVLADPESDPHRYARLLYEVVAARSRVIRPGLQMAGPNTNLKARIQAMESYPQDPRRLRHVRRVSSTIGAVLLVMTISATAVCDLAAQTETEVRPSVPEAPTSMTTKGRPSPQDTTASFVLEDMTITVDGKVVHTRGTIHSPKGVESFFLHTNEHGLFVFSLKPIEGTKKTGQITGNNLHFEVGGHVVHIQSRAPILGGALTPLYVRYDPNYPAERLEAVRERTGGNGASLSNESVRIGSMERADALFDEGPLPQPPGIRFKAGTISFNGVMQQLNGSASVDHLSGFVQIYRRGYGRLTFSGVAFPGARQVAQVEGNVLRAKTDNLDLVIEAEQPILGSERGVLWMRYEPDYKPKRDMDGSFSGGEDLKYLDKVPDLGGASHAATGVPAEGEGR